MAPASSPRSARPDAGDSRTHTAAHATAQRLNQRHADAQAVACGSRRRPDRPDDGHINSQDCVDESPFLRPGTARPAAGGACALDLHHPLERWLGRRPVRWVLRWLARPRRGRPTVIEEVLASYGDPRAPWARRLAHWPLHRLIDRLRGRASLAVFRQRISEHRATVRGLVNTARSIAEYGLTVPQRFSAPLFAVWNFTNRCNLRCRHCYQDSAARPLADELTLPEKLDLVDQMAAECVAMVALAGGEPTVSPDLLPVLRRCRGHGFHVSVATNGTTMTPRLAAELAEAGARYIEVSLDSVHPARHDAFRGQPGMWARTVQGMRCIVRQPGLRLGVAMCVHRGNLAELEDMLRFAVDIGAECFAHFNFVPVGRGLEMAAGDLSPRQRQDLLETLNRWMQSGRIGVISTAPQLGRVCLAGAPAGGRQSCSHAGSARGWKARVVARYLGGCGAGRTYVCVEPNGNITPCVYMPQRVLGNIRRRSFRDIFRHNAFRDLLCDRTRLTHHCQVCRFRDYCGGCRARADAYFGTVNAGDPGCIFNEKHWEALVRHAPPAAVASAAGQPPAGPAPPPAARSYDGCTVPWTEA